MSACAHIQSRGSTAPGNQDKTLLRSRAGAACKVGGAACKGHLLLVWDLCSGPGPAASVGSKLSLRLVVTKSVLLGTPAVGRTYNKKPVIPEEERFERAYFTTQKRRMSDQSKIPRRKEATGEQRLAAGQGLQR